jgi:hypothetical protein
MLAAFVLAAIGFKQDPSLVGVAGVFQRLSIAFCFLWISLLSLRVLRRGA